MTWLSRSGWWLASMALLTTTGVVQGWVSNRWSAPRDLTAAVARLELLPREVGPWVGEDVAVDRAELHRAGLVDGISRRYRDPRTGATVTVLLVCGRPGPVSVHTPDVCYQGAGYNLVTPPTTPISGFRAARMARVDATGSDGLQVYWSWNASGRWEAPSNPRLRFGASPYLYKIYLVRAADPAEADLRTNPAAEFARALAPALDLLPNRD